MPHATMSEPVLRFQSLWKEPKPTSSFTTRILCHLCQVTPLPDWLAAYVPDISTIVNCKGNKSSSKWLHCTLNICTASSPTWPGPGPNSLKPTCYNLPTCLQPLLFCIIIHGFAFCMSLLYYFSVLDQPQPC